MVYPLVSCVCVTNRIWKMKRSIAQFLGQSYENKELVVVSQECDLEVLKNQIHQNTKLKDQIKFVQVPAAPKVTLGELRNISIENARGEYFLQWDDDDWYHRDRISTQLFASLEHGVPVTMIANLLMFDETKVNAYITRSAFWEPSILCRKNLINAERKYPSLSKSEDSEFVRSLPKNIVQSVFGPYLYIYIYHGNNTWDQNHFNKMFFRGQKLSKDVAELVFDVVNDRHTYAEASALLESINFDKEIERISMIWFSEPGYCSGPYR